jgi:Tfp pilus assembly protein PilV
MSPPWRRMLAGESGISMVEVLVAAVILTVAALAIATLAESADHSTFRAEEDQVAVNRLQEEMEHIRQLPFNEIALSGTPVRSTTAGDPNERVSTDGTHFDVNRNGTNPKLLAYAGGTTPDGKAMGCGAAGQPACAINPGPESFQSGDVSGKIYRYVVYPGVPANCTGCSADYFKRIIVIVKINTTPVGGTHAYQEIQSNVSNPDATPSSNPVNPTQTTDQQVATFWLTDTPCSNTTRVPPTNDHATHDTRGDCTITGAGVTTSPADLMFAEPPSGSSSDPTYNYSTDVLRDETPRIGLTMMTPQTVPGCALQVATTNAPNQLFGLPSAEVNPQLEMHTWLSTPLNSTFATLTDADATLELWSKSVGGAAYEADLCVYVFKRITVQQQLSGGATNTFVVDSPATQVDLGANPYLEIQKGTWPQEWTKVSSDQFNVRMLSVDSVLNSLSNQGVSGTLTSPSQRLGLALTINSSATTGDGLDMMYDHPTFDSRFELDTPKGSCVIPCT